MTLLTPWFLAGLVALAPLVALHLRRRRRQREVSSLLLWRALPSTAAGRRRAALVLPLLLALQALFVVLVVLGLAQPRGDAGTSGRERGAAQVVVLDDALRSGSAEAAHERLTAAREEIDRRLAQLTPGTPVSVVVAGAAPRLLVVAASPGAARGAFASLPTVAAAPANAPAPDLRSGLALAAGQLHGDGARVTLVHAPQDTAPQVRTEGVSYAAIAIGDGGPGQALEQPVARCAPGEVGDGDAAGAPASGGGATGSAGAPASGSGETGSATVPASGRGDDGANTGSAAAAPSAPRCTVFAAIRNDARVPARELLRVERGRRLIASRTLSIAGESRAGVSFDAAPGAQLTLRLVGARAGATDAYASVTVPGVPEPAAVTLVSSRPRSQPLARALTSVPGAALRLVPPADYSAADNRAADLVVFDRWMPDGGLPEAPAVLLVDPPQLPGGRVGVALAEPELSGTDTADPLLAGVDLDGLAIAAGAARTIALPSALRAIAWAPGGPLIAAGQPAANRRVALLAFDPQASTLPQQPAFPILIANVVAWSLGQLAPDGATPGADAGGSGAGTAGAGADAGGSGAGSAGAGADAGGSGAGSAGAPSDGAGTLVLRATDGGAVAPGHRPAWWPWLVAAALLVLLAEWSYPRWTTRGDVRA